MNSASDRKAVFAVLIVVALGLIVLGASVYRSKSNELRQLQSRLSGEKARLADVKEKINRIPELEGKFSKLRARLDFLEPSLPDAAYIPTFLKQIENLATSTGNDILMVRPKPKQKTASAKSQQVQINAETGEVSKQGTDKAGAAKQAKEPEKLPYEFVPIEVKLGGTYSTAVDFLAALQRFPKMIAVNNLSFVPAGSQANEYYSPRLTADMELLAVVLKKGDKDGKSG